MWRQVQECLSFYQALRYCSVVNLWSRTYLPSFWLRAQLIQSAPYLTSPLPSSPYRQHTRTTHVTETFHSHRCKHTKPTSIKACTWSSGEYNWWPVSRREPLDTTTVTRIIALYVHIQIWIQMPVIKRKYCWRIPILLYFIMKFQFRFQDICLT